MDAHADLLLDARAQLGEGPIWDPLAQRLWWVDILAGMVHAYDPASGSDRAIPVGEHVGTVVPRTRGGLMLAVRRGLAACDPATGRLELWAEPEAGRDGIRFNDGKCDPQGRFWAGTMAYDNAAGAGNLWRLDPDCRVQRMVGGVTISNGVAWDVARSTFYHIDSPTRTVAAWDYDDATGAIARRRTAIACAPDDGFPDGCALDAEGMLWVAHWGGAQVIRWDPRTGRALQRLRVPVPQPSAVAFQGTRLYITSARVDLPAEELARCPQSGGIFCADVGVAGAPTWAFAG